MFFAIATIISSNKKDDLLIFKWHGTDESFNAFKEDVIQNNLPIDVIFDGAKAAVSLEERIRRKFGIHGVVIGLKDESNRFYGLKFLKSIALARMGRLLTSGLKERSGEVKSSLLEVLSGTA